SPNHPCGNRIGSLLVHWRHLSTHGFTAPDDGWNCGSCAHAREPWEDYAAFGPAYACEARLIEVDQGAWRRRGRVCLAGWLLRLFDRRIRARGGACVYCKSETTSRTARFQGRGASFPSEIRRRMGRAICLGLRCGAALRAAGVPGRSPGVSLAEPRSTPGY